MLEMIAKPMQGFKGTWKMFFVGLVFASLSILLVHWFFSADAALSKASGMIVVAFCVMFTLPFLYLMLKQEEVEDESVEGLFSVLKAHSDALLSFMWLFLGFIVAFSFWFIILQNTMLFNSQIETYCIINSPYNVEDCVTQNDFTRPLSYTGAATKELRLLSILENNVYVMIFTLIFSLIFGAGAIFVLAWNASVISFAVSSFADYRIMEIPLGIARYMFHGAFEIAAYFIAALAGGIIGVGVMRNGIMNQKFLKILENSVILLFIAIIILAFAAAFEVYLTPLFIH